MLICKCLIGFFYACKIIFKHPFDLLYLCIKILQFNGILHGKNSHYRCARTDWY